MPAPKGPRPVANDFTGQRIPGTRWTVTTRNFDQKVRGVFWNVVCDCGNTAVVITGNLKSGASRSCGCYSAERTSEVRTTHGKTHSQVWNVWCNMRERCSNPNNIQYHNYGGRGIKVCDEWQNSFEAFYAHVGDPPDSALTIDRINNNGNYEPGNVRWATRTEQARNKQSSVLYTHEGVTKNVSTWAQEHNMGYGILHYRLFVKKMSFKDAVSTPSARPRKSNKQ